MTGYRVEIEDLLYAHPGSDWQLRIPHFTLEAGEFRAIIGPNGSGKSTFMRLLAGLLHPRSGRLLFDGKNLRKMERRQIARILGYLPAETVSEFDYPVAEIVAMGRYAYLPVGGFMNREDKAVIQRAMEMTEITHLRKRRVSQLSDGERQRTFLASVLAQEPSLLLLDEPTSALDIHHQVHFFQIISDLAKQGIAILIVLHDINMASLFCDKISLFDGGRIVRMGTPREVLQEDTLSSVYGERLVFMKHPIKNRPIVFPVG